MRIMPLIPLVLMNVDIIFETTPNQLTMIKNIIITVLALVCIFLGVFAQIQTTEADKQKWEAKTNMELVQQHREAAEAYALEAEMAAADALIVESKAKRLQQELEDCKK